MGGVTDRADELVDQLRASSVRAGTEIRATRPPCVLVVPIPEYDFNILGEGAAEVTWTLYALGNHPGDVKAARQLEGLVMRAQSALAIETATPTAYQIPGTSDPVPAYQLTMTDAIQITEQGG